MERDDIKRTFVKGFLSGLGYSLAVYGFKKVSEKLEGENEHHSS